jgi:hypothetical protein
MFRHFNQNEEIRTKKLRGRTNMPGFDKNLDKELFSESVDLEKSVITVAVFSYNGGTPKLQISRQNRNAESELSFAKLGRLTKEEVEAILPLIEKAKGYL